MANEKASPAEPASTDHLSEPRRAALNEIFGEKFASSYMGPILFMDDQQLHSPAAVQFFRRDFSFISKVLNYEYQYRSWNGFNQELLDRYAEMIAKKLSSIGTLLDNWCNRFNKLMETNGVKMENSLYPNSLTMSVPITNGHARGYFMLLKELDRVNLLAGTANMLGVIDSKVRAEAEFQCKKAVRAFAAALRNEVLRLYREADRLKHGDKDAGAKDATLDEQGKTLAEFGNAMAADGKTDRALDVSSSDPGQLIEDAAAATTAAAAAAAGDGKTRRTTAKKASATAAAPAAA